MKIIKKGRPQKGWSKLAICTGKGNGWGGCWSILRISREDLYSTCRYSAGEIDQYCTTFSCPNCGVETDVRVPGQIDAFLPERKNWFKAREEKVMRRKEFLCVDGVVTIADKEIVLIERTKPPYENKLVLPGGHVDEGEKLEEACARELEEEIGLKVEAGDLKILTILDASGRDPRPNHGLSIVYWIDLPTRDALNGCKAASDARTLHVKNINELRPDEIGFDHWRAIEQLKAK